MTPALALKAFATLTAVMGLTPIVAPIIAGYVVIVSTAHMVFALLILLGLLIFLGSWYLIPTSDDGHERRSLRDYVRGYRQLLQSRVSRSDLAVCRAFSLRYLPVQHFSLNNNSLLESTSLALYGAPLPVSISLAQRYCLDSALLVRLTLSVIALPYCP